jgi:hypothetical protein
MGDGIEGQKLTYGGNVVGFVRTPKRPKRNKDYLTLTRGRDESDDAFLSRILDLEAREYNKQQRINTRHRALSPSLVIAKRALLDAQQARIVTQAEKIFDSAYFDMDLNHLKKTLRLLTGYYTDNDVRGRRQMSYRKGTGLNETDARADRLLKGLVAAKNPAPSGGDVKAYDDFIAVAAYTFLSVGAKQPQTLQDYADILASRDARGLSDVFMHQSVEGMYTQQSRLHDNRFSPDGYDIEFLSYGNPQAVVALSIEKNAAFLYPVLQEALDKIERWARKATDYYAVDTSRSLTDIYMDKSFAGGVAFAAFVMEQTRKAIAENHPQAGRIKYFKEKLEGLGQKQTADLNSEKERAEKGWSRRRPP